MTDEETLVTYMRARRDAEQVYRQCLKGQIVCSDETAARLDGLVGEAREAEKRRLVLTGEATWAVDLFG